MLCSILHRCFILHVTTVYFERVFDSDFCYFCQICAVLLFQTWAVTVQKSVVARTQVLKKSLTRLQKLTAKLVWLLDLCSRCYSSRPAASPLSSSTAGDLITLNALHLPHIMSLISFVFCTSSIPSAQITVVRISVLMLFDRKRPCERCGLSTKTPTIENNMLLSLAANFFLDIRVGFDSRIVYQSWTYMSYCRQRMLTDWQAGRLMLTVQVSSAAEATCQPSGC